MDFNNIKLHYNIVWSSKIRKFIQWFILPVNTQTLLLLFFWEKAHKYFNTQKQGLTIPTTTTIH